MTNSKGSPTDISNRAIDTVRHIPTMKIVGDMRYAITKGKYLLIGEL